MVFKNKRKGWRECKVLGFMMPLCKMDLFLSHKSKQHDQLALCSLQSKAEKVATVLHGGKAVSESSVRVGTRLGRRQMLCWQLLHVMPP